MCVRVTLTSQLPSEWSFKMIKALSLRLNQCSGRLPSPLSRGPLKRERLDIYLRTSFVVGNFGKWYPIRVFFFRKCAKFNADSKNAQKNSEKMFCFWDKCIWLVRIHLSLLITEYMSQAVTVLWQGLKNFNVSKSDFCKSITSTVITEVEKGALIKIEWVFWPVYHVACREVLSNESF